MAIVAILGAGDLGAALAHKLAARDRVAEVRLIDAAAGVAAGKALDIQQAGPIEGFRTRLVAGGDALAAAGASVVVLADQVGPPASEWQGEPALALLKRLAQLDTGAPFVCAGASQRRLIERGVGELGIPRARLVGSAPGALASALRAMVALEAGGSPADVSVDVLGAPPDHTVVPWQAATVRGSPLTEALHPPQIARLNARLPHLWPPGPYTLASAAARVSEAIAVGGSRRAFSCFVALDGEVGARGRVSAMTVTLDGRGVAAVIAPALSVQERVQLDNALAAE